MKELINKLIKKFLTREIILYLIFGIVTTLVSIGSFALFTRVFSLEENLSNILSIILAITVAFFTNRTLVFNSQAKTVKDFFSEVFKFILSRALTMLIEIFGFVLMFEILHINDLISKISITFLVIILNYIFSKLFVFKK